MKYKYIVSILFVISVLLSVAYECCYKETYGFFRPEAVMISEESTCESNRSIDNILIPNTKLCHEDSFVQQEAGPSFKWVKKLFESEWAKSAWEKIKSGKIFKSIGKWFEEKFESIGKWFKDLFGIAEDGENEFKESALQFLPHLEVLNLTNMFNDIHSSEDIERQIIEYINTTPINSNNTVKTIKCLHKDAENVKCVLSTISTIGHAKREKDIEMGFKVLRLSEYDLNLNNIEKSKPYINDDGLEVVDFKILKKPQSVFNGIYQDRIREQCLIFSVPNDANMIKKVWALLNDLAKHPQQLFDEYTFRKELAKNGIDSRDITEIENYEFVYIIIENEDTEPIQEEVA